MRLEDLNSEGISRLVDQGLTLWDKRGLLTENRVMYGSSKN